MTETAELTIYETAEVRLSQDMPLVSPNAQRETTWSAYASLRRELNLANADYRILALHAGLLDSVTVDARQRAVSAAGLLRAEMEKMRRLKNNAAP